MRLGKIVQIGRGNSLIAVFLILAVMAIPPAPTGTARAANVPKTVAEIALYQGPDREKIMLEGARKEGQLTFYHSWTWLGTVAKEFEKKYPFIKVSAWRSDSQEGIKRITEEYAAGRYINDVIETSAPAILVFLQQGIFQEYYSPDISYYDQEVMARGKTGVYYLGHLEDYIGLGFNTGRVPMAEAPKHLKELVDPNWKGKMSIAGSSTGLKWLGNALDVMGREYIAKLSRQDIKVQKVSGAALAGLIASGEVPLSPTIYISNMITAKRKGAPVEWQPLEPVVVNGGYSGMSVKAPHPHAAVLFLDYLHSQEGQKSMVKGGLNSPRKDMGTSGLKFKKAYLEAKYKSLNEYEKNYNAWEDLLRRSFLKAK